MNAGLATKALSDLIGDDALLSAWRLYKDIERLPPAEGAEAILDKLRHAHKLHLTAKAEQAVFSIILDDHKVYDRPGLVWDILQTLWAKKRRGPRRIHSFDTLVSVLAYRCREKKARSYWPLIVDFLKEQGIGATTVAELKSHTRRLHEAGDCNQDILFWIVFSLQQGDEGAEKLVRSMLPATVKAYFDKTRFPKTKRNEFQSK